MREREVYPNAPLRLVSLEIKFPITGRILTRSLWDSVEKALGDELPDVDVALEEPESTIPHAHRKPVLRRTSRDRKRAVTLYAGALTIELADYQRYGDLKALTKVTLAALHEVPSLSQATRVGLRYINEARYDLLESPEGKWQRAASWDPYINSALLSSVQEAPGGLCAFAHQGTFFFHSPKGEEQASLDYGIHPHGIIDPEDVLILNGDDSGPCFILDIDAFRRTSPKEPIPDVKGLVRAFDRLHEVVELIFQWSITDRMREVFRAPAPDQSDESLLPASNA
jgi:uncharacterized protein (TIGR04255 family)